MTVWFVINQSGFSSATTTQLQWRARTHAHVRKVVASSEERRPNRTLQIGRISVQIRLKSPRRLLYKRFTRTNDTSWLFRKASRGGKSSTAHASSPLPRPFTACVTLARLPNPKVSCRPELLADTGRRSFVAILCFNEHGLVCS